MTQIPFNYMINYAKQVGGVHNRPGSGDDKVIHRAVDYSIYEKPNGDCYVVANKINQG